MKKILNLTLALLVLPTVLLAQSNFKPGYVVDMKGDTLKGSIDYKEWEKTPKQITFKSSSGATQEYSPLDTKAFAVTGLEYYETHKVDVSMDQVDLTKLGGVLDTSHRSDTTIFLKTMTKGRCVSLYSYEDNVKVRYYILEPGNAQPQELAYHVYTDGTVKYVNRYRIQLQYVASKNNVNNPKLTETLARSDYDQKDILSVVALINGSDPAQFIAKSQFGMRLFAGAGVSYNDMLFTGSISYGDAYTLYPKVSLGIDLLPNKITQQLFLRVELSATADSHDFKNTYEGSELKVNQNTAALILQAYYSFYNGQKVKVFAGGGIAVNFSTYPVHYYYSVLNPTVTSTVNTAYPDYHKLWESFLLKAGVILDKKIEIYAGYSPPTTLTNNYADFAGNVVSYQAGVNFLFGSK